MNLRSAFYREGKGNWRFPVLVTVIALTIALLFVVITLFSQGCYSPEEKAYYEYVREAKYIVEVQHATFYTNTYYLEGKDLILEDCYKVYHYEKLPKIIISEPYIIIERR